MSEVIVATPEQLKALIKSAVNEVLQASSPTEAWLPVSTVAERLGKSEKTVRNMIHDGRFTRVSGGDGSPYCVSSLEVAELSRSASSSPEAS